MTRTLIGKFYADCAPMTLGNILVFWFELVFMARIKGIESVYLETNKDPSPAVMDALQTLRPYVQLSSFDSTPRNESVEVHPQFASEVDAFYYDYGGFKRIERLHAEYGEFFPDLKFADHLSAGARQILSSRPDGKRRIAVHLKNQPGLVAESNANLDEWFHFFKLCSETHHGVLFFLVGSDQVPEKFLSLPNIIPTQRQGSHLAQDLAVIAKADGFMGMSSGLAQIAIFGRKPYAIFKNPEHHADLASGVLGSMGRVGFAQAANQVFIRQYETVELLVAMLEGLQLEGRLN